MSGKDEFQICRFGFDDQLPNLLIDLEYAEKLWPVVYILNDGTIDEAYIGETTDTISRIRTHLKSNHKSKLSSAYLICSDKFNKSATLDLESSLIKYMSADGRYKLQNGNLGLANHNYYQKQEIYHRMFRSVWDRLRAKGIVIHSLEHIDNSNLFKYSPYKSLSREQRYGVALILESMLRDDFQNIVVEGGAGTGKTIVAIYLFKLLHTPVGELGFAAFEQEDERIVDLVTELKKKYPDPKMALVIPMESFRNTIKKVFKRIKGLKANMVIGPSEVIRKNYDLVLVDESHRLRRRVNLGNYIGTFDKVCNQLGLDRNSSSELDWIRKRHGRAVFFYDEDQSIKPSDVLKGDFDELKSSPLTLVEQLRSQFRVRGGADYVDFVKKLLRSDPGLARKRIFKDYELLLFNDLGEMIRQIEIRESQHGLARIVAGYSWPWISRNDSTAFDIQIGDIKLRWNSVTKDWLNSRNATNEVGCIHTTQGYDINYAGIIFGEEIGYDLEKKDIVIRRENYHDKNGKQTITNPDELKAFILNIYQTLLLRGIRGSYIYVCDENLRAYFAERIQTYSDPAKYSVVSSREVRKKDENREIQLVPFKNSVPLFDLRVAAGDFSPPQDTGSCIWVPVPANIHLSQDYFACTIVGESMNKIIPNGSVCLFRKYAGGSRSGKIVLVKLTHLQDPDFGSQYTIKEYQSQKSYDETGEWQHETIRLLPRSFDPAYKPIILEGNELDFIEVVGMFECVLPSPLNPDSEQH